MQDSNLTPTRPACVLARLGFLWHDAGAFAALITQALDLNSKGKASVGSRTGRCLPAYAGTCQRDGPYSAAIWSRAHEPTLVLLNRRPFSFSPCHLQDNISLAAECGIDSV